MPKKNKNQGNRERDFENRNWDKGGDERTTSGVGGLGLEGLEIIVINPYKPNDTLCTIKICPFLSLQHDYRKCDCNSRMIALCNCTKHVPNGVSYTKKYNCSHIEVMLQS